MYPISSASSAHKLSPLYRFSAARVPHKAWFSSHQPTLQYQASQPIVMWGMHGFLFLAGTHSHLFNDTSGKTRSRKQQQQQQNEMLWLMLIMKRASIYDTARNLAVERFTA